ncbi:SGNH/GDSL hydrolase family protein [Crossiella sp. CA-258035]|uniref:SGNH/GDSL hydrolase family protein n=1 Tax=Crossiella sp. CA-258035 TaxID=2981138 RepID=UPI0024BC07BF|nr:SGNH/GDSL hydrolase family protein [Crossiella sp. CA-258035]WHT21447.1 SGNH/GDSL hydrolase family protein [Crossiella sp. CA-258035]
MVWHRFVAVGDSVTEGLGDPDAHGGFRGWADRLAEAIADRQGSVRYANLAVRGLTTRRVLETQLAPAQELAPDLVTAVVGMNDVIRPSLNPLELAADLDALFGGLRATGATVLTATIPAPGLFAPLPPALRGRMDRRITRMNAVITAAARRHGLLCMDLAALTPSGMAAWAEDRLHPGPAAHQAMAAAGLAVLDGVAPALEVNVAEPVDADHLRWLRTFLWPWLVRRLRGQSSGDGRVAKLPAYRALPATS